MSKFSDPNGFRLGEVVEWCNQAGPGARPNGMPCVILGPFDFYEGWNDAIGAVDFGFGYDVRDEDGTWFAFVREVRKRPPPGPHWFTLCKLNQVGADWEDSLTAQMDHGLLHAFVEA